MPSNFDIILYGATGFTGRQAAKYLKNHAPKELRWAIGGRSQEKLEALAKQLDLPSDHFVVADSMNKDQITAMVGQGRIIVSTVGPFAKYGKLLIEQCCIQGKHYLDITGETPFVGDMIDKWEPQAKESGAKLIPLSGFDSVPSDLAVYYCVKKLLEQNLGCRQIRSFYKLKGGFNGGTIASALYMAESGQDKRVMNPQLLMPKDMRSKKLAEKSKQSLAPVYVKEFKAWSPPFFMAPINSAVVFRSYALFKKHDFSYGDNFIYQERMNPMKSRLMAGAVSAGSAGFGMALHFSPTRKLVEKFAPNPGEGPSDKDIESGFFKNTLLCEAEDGKLFKAELSAQGDPGNKVTTQILCESALCLATEESQLKHQKVSGFLTPSFAFGDHLLKRLQEQNYTFKFEAWQNEG